MPAILITRAKRHELTAVREDLEFNQISELFQRFVQIINTLYAAVILNTYVNGLSSGKQQSPLAMNRS